MTLLCLFAPLLHIWKLIKDICTDPLTPGTCFFSINVHKAKKREVQGPGKVLGVFLWSKLHTLHKYIAFDQMGLKTSGAKPQVPSPLAPNEQLSRDKPRAEFPACCKYSKMQ